MGSLYYKLGQVLQSEKSLWQNEADITKWDKVLVQFVKLDIITKCDKSYEKVGQVFITKWGIRY